MKRALCVVALLAAVVRAEAPAPAPARVPAPAPAPAPTPVSLAPAPVSLAPGGRSPEPPVRRARLFDFRGWYVPVGVVVGAALHDEADNGFLFGGEASVVRIGEDFWGGFYADIVRDFGFDATRVSFGPEGGFRTFGVDGGFLVETADGESRTGWTVRGLLMGPGFGFFARLSYFGGDGDERAGEVGVLLKLPVPLVRYD